MLEPIIVEFSGDCWNRPTHFIQQLNQIPPGESVVLDMRSEGPSLESLGVCDVINNWLSQRQQSPGSVQLLRWSNPVEPVPYKRVNCSNPSHFFPMSQNYWVDTTPNIEQQLSYNNFFGLFIGRITFEDFMYNIATQLVGMGCVAITFLPIKTYIDLAS